jgi:hypothetical protein
MPIQPLSLTDLAALLPRLQATVELLSGKQRVAATGNRRGRRRGVAGDAVREKLLGALKGQKKGLSLGQLSKRLGLAGNVIGYNLRHLRAQKKTRLVGSRRQARWFAA